MSRYRPLARRSVIDGIAKASPPAESAVASAVKSEGHHYRTSSAPPHQDEPPPSVASLQNEPVTSRASTTTEVPHYLLAKRPQIVLMRNLSPEQQAKVLDEYYQNYDVMTGLRIAATLGGLITLFTLFLFYKSKCKSYKEADLSPISDDTSTPGSFKVVALQGALESNLTNQAPCSSTYHDPYYLPPEREDFPRHKRHYHHYRYRNSNSGVAYPPETILNPSYGGQNANTTTLSTPSTSSNSVTSTNVTSAEVNVISPEQRHRNSSVSLTKRGVSPGPYQQTSVESENPEPSTSSYQGSAGSDWAKEIVISKRHLWVQYRPNNDSSDGAKSEDV